MQKNDSKLIRVLLADEHTAVRAFTKAYFDNHREIEIVGESASGDDALWSILQHRPHVVLLDIEIARLSGLSVIRRIKRQCPGVHVVVWTTHERPSIIHRSLRSGVCAYVLKRDSIAELVSVIRDCAARQPRVSAHVSKILETQTGGAKHVIPMVHLLTRAEQKVFDVIGRGATMKAAAEQLNRSPHTIDTHLRRIKKKLGVDTKAELARLHGCDME